MKYFFRFGKTPNLSFAELSACLRRLMIDFEIVDANNFYAIIESDGLDDEVDFKNLIAQLGGTVKVGKILDSVEHSEEVKNLIINDISLLEGKKIFGLTSLSNNYSQSSLNNLGMVIKKEFESARFVTSKEKELSSVIVTKEKLLERGGDYYVLNFMNQDYLGKTLAVQDFKDYDHRDYDRPRADSKSGMLPPKLCLMMINLAQAPRDSVIWDPFCGSGTVLQEALLLGYEKVIGSDISEKAIDDTQVNLEWLQGEYGISLDNVSLYQVAISEAGSEIKSADIVVTEPYLGPALRGGESKEQLLKIKSDLERMFLSAFKQYKSILSKKGVVVSVVPALVNKKDLIYLDILRGVNDLGFKLVEDFEDLENNQKRYPLVYSRSDQKVIREIMVFKKI